MADTNTTPVIPPAPVLVDVKPWWKSKVVWIGIIGTLRGIYEVLQVSLPSFTSIHLPTIPPSFDAIAGMLLGTATVHGRVTATSVINS